MYNNRKYILNKTVAENKLRRMALEICEQNYNESSLVLIGIRGSGMVIAEKISGLLQQLFKGAVTVVQLDIDKKQPDAVTLMPAVDCNKQVVILVDDVANSGRTMLYALKPLLQTYPKKIQTLALVERTHKSFPVEVDYKGLSVSTNFDEHIYVEVAAGEITGAWMA